MSLDKHSRTHQIELGCKKSLLLKYMQLYSVSLILLVLIFCFVSGFLERIYILLAHGLAHLNELAQKETEQGFEAELKNCRKKN